MLRRLRAVPMPREALSHAQARQGHRQWSGGACG